MKSTKSKSNLAPSNLNTKTEKNIDKLEEKFPRISAKQKKRLIEKNLTLSNSKKKKFQTVSISKIIDPPNFSRLDDNDTYGNLEMVKTLEPIKIAEIIDSDLFVIVDGHRRLLSLKNKGKSKIKVEIIGMAKCTSQLSVARAMAVTQVRKPLSIPELALGVVNLYNDLKREFGKNAFHTHGGDRKGKGKNKASIGRYISKILNMRYWTVQALLNFGLRVGPDILMILHDHSQIKMLSLRKIQQINSHLKDAKLRDELQNQKNEMHECGASEKEVVLELGKIISSVISDAMEKMKQKGKSSPNENTDLKTTGDGDGEEMGENKRGDISAKEIARMISKIQKATSVFTDQLKSIRRALPDKKHVSDDMEKFVRSLKKSLTKTKEEIEIYIKQLGRYDIN